MWPLSRLSFHPFGSFESSPQRSMMFNQSTSRFILLEYKRSQTWSARIDVTKGWQNQDPPSCDSSFVDSCHSKFRTLIENGLLRAIHPGRGSIRTQVMLVLVFLPAIKGCLQTPMLSPLLHQLPRLLPRISLRSLCANHQDKLRAPFRPRVGTLAVASKEFDVGKLKDVRRRAHTKRKIG